MNTRNAPDRRLLNRAVKLAHEIGGNLRRSLLPLFLCSVFYRVIAFTILVPLVGGYAGLFFSGSGRLVIANEEIAAFILQPIGLLALLAIAACSLTLFALEQGCLMALLSQKESADSLSRVVRAFRYTFKRIIGIHQLALRVVIRIILTGTPFIILAGLIYQTLLSENDINYYLTNQPFEFKAAVIGGILLATGFTVTLIRYMVRVVFSLPILMFEAKHPADALRASASKAARQKRPIAMGIACWGLIVVVVSSVSTAAFMQAGQLSVPFLLGHHAYLVPVIGLLFLGLTLCQFLISIGATASFSALVMTLYGIHHPYIKESKDSQSGNQLNRSSHTFPLSGRALIAGVVISFIAAVITGWFLLSHADISETTEIVAHRGASGSAPENTMSAVNQAISDGAHWVEIDVQRTADDQVVVVHDRDLVRIGNTSLVVSQTPYQKIARIDVGSWFAPRFSDQRVPTLEAVLDQCRGKIKVNIELKYYAWDPDLASRVIAIVEKARMGKEIVVMSLRPIAVEQVKRQRPDWQVGLLAAATLTDLARAEADFVAVHSRMVTPGFVRRIHRSGKTIQVWTVNDTIGMTKMFGMGVDAIITDVPGLAVQLLAMRAGMDPVERMLVTAGLLVVGDEAHVDPLTDGV